MMGSIIAHADDGAGKQRPEGGDQSAFAASAETAEGRHRCARELATVSFTTISAEPNRQLELDTRPPKPSARRPRRCSETA
jgi:hypothetical protein